jgi:hypothetical protein
MKYAHKKVSLLIHQLVKLKAVLRHHTAVLPVNMLNTISRTVTTDSIFVQWIPHFIDMRNSTCLTIYQKQKIKMTSDKQL